MSEVGKPRDNRRRRPPVHIEYRTPGWVEAVLLRMQKPPKDPRSVVWAITVLGFLSITAARSGLAAVAIALLGSVALIVLRWRDRV